MRKKLLLVAPTCDGEDVGEAWVSYQWALRLAERHEVTLVTYYKRGARPASEQLSGLRVVEWPEMSAFHRAERLNSMLKPGYVPFYFRARRWIRRALARGETFEVAHQPTPVAMRYPSPASGLGIPLVIGPVGGGLRSPPGFAAEERTDPWFMKLRALDHLRIRWDPLLRGTLEQASCVLGIAPYVKEGLSGLDLRRLEFMSETALDALPGPVERARSPRPVRLLFVGRLVRTKGIRDVIRAMPLLSDLALLLDVVGEGPERRACEELVAQCGLADRVVLHGWKSKSEVADFYRKADLFVFPSYREPGGNVALEAMGHGLPLIVVDRGGPGSAVSDECAIRLGAISPEALAHEIADAVRRLVADPDLRLRMGKAAYDHVGRTGLWSAHIDRISQIYDEISAADPVEAAWPAQLTPPRNA